MSIIVNMHSTKKPVTTMLTYPWKCTVLHCNHLGNTWKPLVLMTQHFDYCPSVSEGDNQSVGSSAPVVSRCFPGGYNVKLYISRGRLAWWLLAFLHSDALPETERSSGIQLIQCMLCYWRFICIFHMWIIALFIISSPTLFQTEVNDISIVRRREYTWQKNPHNIFARLHMCNMFTWNKQLKALFWEQINNTSIKNSACIKASMPIMAKHFVLDCTQMIIYFI